MGERDSTAASPLTILHMHFCKGTKGGCWSLTCYKGQLSMGSSEGLWRRGGSHDMPWWDGCMNGCDVNCLEHCNSIHCLHYMPVAWLRVRRNTLEQDHKDILHSPAPLCMLFLHDTGYETKNIGSASGSNFRVNCFFTRHWNHNFSSIKLTVNVLGDSEL